MRKRTNLKVYEYARRTDADGEKNAGSPASTVCRQSIVEQRKACLRAEVRSKLSLDSLMAKRVASKPILSKIRKFDGYTVQNFALGNLPDYTFAVPYTPLVHRGNMRW